MKVHQKMISRIDYKSTRGCWFCETRRTYDVNAASFPSNKWDFYQTFYNQDSYLNPKPCVEFCIFFFFSSHVGHHHFP